MKTLQERLDEKRQELTKARIALGLALHRHEDGEARIARETLDEHEKAVRDIEAMIEALPELEKLQASERAITREREKNEAERRAKIEAWSVHPEGADIEQAKKLFTRDYEAGMSRTVAADRRAYALLKSVHHKGYEDTLMRQFLKQHAGIPHLKEILAGTWKSL